MNEQMTCDNCGGIKFHLDPAGKIICAGDKCHAEFGTWIADCQSALFVQVPWFRQRRAG